jgi:RNA polymerase sigma-70 factor (ECF subfamily)
LNEPERVLPWLYRLHRHAIADALRNRAGRERLVDSNTAAPDVPAREPSDVCRCGLAQAKRLNPAYAEVLTLVDAGDATLTEAAAALGISVNNATVRLHRARKALREAMLEHCGVQNYRDCVDCPCASEGCCAA